MKTKKPSLNQQRVLAAASWQTVFRLGAIVALVALTGTLVDIVLAMVPGWETTTVPDTMQDWFVQLQTNPWLGLRNLDLLNITVSIISVPMLLALFGAQRTTSPGLAALALSVGLIGAAVFVTNNAALPMLDLSRQYVAATSETQRLSLEAAGLALLAKGAHGSLGAFFGFFLSSLGTLLMSLAMLQNAVFGKAAGWIGVIGISLLGLYTIGTTFVPDSEAAMMALAMPGGLLMMAWQVMVARRLLLLGRSMSQ